MPQLSDLPVSDNTQLLLGVVACLGAIAVIFRVYLPGSKSGFPLPPSPPNRRLLGHFVPPRNAFLTVAKWIDQYGPLITIRTGTENIVIIGRHKAAMDIMEKHGVLLADRPRMIAAQMLTGGLTIAFSCTGDRFRRMRRALHTHLQPKAAETYQPLQMSFAKNTVLNILDDPHNFQNHMITYSVTTIMAVTYGKTTPTSVTDPDVRAVRQLLDVYRTVLRPGAYLVDTIPWLRYLPWYGQKLKQEFKSNRKLFAGQMNRLKQQLQNNVDVSPSFGKYLLENEHLYGLTEMEMHYLSGTLFAGGVDSSAAAISTVLMAAACFPEEQAKVQAELDAVIGRHRAPTFVDQKSLPLLDAFISEAQRWRPLGPNGFPHRTTKDVVWASENYCIPAGTTVLGSHWAISRDPEVYPEPHAFKPQRWIDEQGRLRDDLTFCFYGFGRRVCPGQHLADRSVFINSLLVLWAFQLTLDPTKPLDDVGFMHVAIPDVPCPIEFKLRVPDAELRCMMQNYPEVE
ncbi:cytochrome P450 [Suillus paluster]|uniref:cytochrome P450 n=1 Tax=Suillus paluster TaxID=48578 RepID=UPI001B86012B|nr:cytochrome P450 [Suillus paluster]KAG1756247.1 cytochrome P450 [Suillus paluster]